MPDCPLVPLLLAFVLIAACGGSGGGSGPDGLPVGPPKSGVVRVVAVLPDALPPGVQGQYRRDGDDGLIVVRADVLAGREASVQIIAHEIGHALGLSHVADTSCLMSGGVLPFPAALCHAEEAFARTFIGALSVVAADLALRAHTIESCALWNAASGSEILSLSR